MDSDTGGWYRKQPIWQYNFISYRNVHIIQMGESLIKKSSPSEANLSNHDWREDNGTDDDPWPSHSMLVQTGSCADSRVRVVPLKFQVTLTVLLVVWTIIPMPNPGSVKVKSRVDDWPLKPLGFLYVNFENFRKLQTHWAYRMPSLSSTSKESIWLFDCADIWKLWSYDSVSLRRRNISLCTTCQDPSRQEAWWLCCSFDCQITRVVWL